MSVNGRNVDPWESSSTEESTSECESSDEQDEVSSDTSTEDSLHELSPTDQSSSEDEVEHNITPTDQSSSEEEVPGNTNTRRGGCVSGRVRQTRGCRALRGRSQVRGQSQNRGQTRGCGQAQTRRARTTDRYTDHIPISAKSIDLTDIGFQEPDEFHPIRSPGPKLPSDDLAELNLFNLFIGVEVLERLVSATNVYAEQKKDQRKAMNRRFKLSPLTNEEMMAYIGVLLLLSISSVRSYRQAWDVKSSQVGIIHYPTYCLVQMNILSIQVNFLLFAIFLGSCALVRSYAEESF